VFEQITLEAVDLHRHRESFLDLWTLVAEAHPSGACRAGASELLLNLDIWWPPGAGALWSPSQDMRDLRVCGDAPRGYVQCRGSRPDSRGFTCGLWMLLHALSAG